MMWFITKLRSTAIFGIVNTTWPLFTSDHGANSAGSGCSSSFPRALLTLASKVASRAATEAGAFGRASSPPAATSNDEPSSMMSTQCGMFEMCAARCPIVNDFSCGFQAKSASGTRSSSRRVVPISWSYSGRRLSLSAMGSSGLLLESDLRERLRGRRCFEVGILLEAEHLGGDVAGEAPRRRVVLLDALVVA